LSDVSPQEQTSRPKKIKEVKQNKGRALGHCQKGRKFNALTSMLRIVNRVLIIKAELLIAQKIEKRVT